MRTFLLDAPLELVGDAVLDVALEAQAGGGRRIDVEAGRAAIEVKKNLGSRAAFDQGVSQLAGYVRERTDACAQRYVGVLTDGQTWALFHLTPDGELAEVSRLRLRGGSDAAALASWLEPVLATTDQIDPSPKEIIRRLGAESSAAQLDLADLRALYEACRHEPEVELKRELWARLLLSALGTNFSDSDELFVVHTYLVLVAELVAHQVMGLPVGVPDGDVRALLEGQRFAVAGLHGVVEADFFDWPATVPHGQPVIAGIARRLSRFDWSAVDRDVLKALYESVIDSETRRKLGEYYTPDWLAQKMVEAQFTDPLRQRLLDPACGSGTFLFWAVRHLLAACDESGMSNREALDRVVAQVQGMDLHPVAVTLARVTYLLALTRERLEDRGELTVPVFLGDSVRWDHDDVSLTDHGMTVRTSDELQQLIPDELHFPEGVIEEPARFDRLIDDLAERAARRKRGSKPPSVAGLLNRHKVIAESDRDAVTTAFHKLCRLHDSQRDHVWSYYIRNRVRPLSFTRADGRADVLVGNPPWLAYRSMPSALQDRYRALADEYGLWAGGKVATHQDLSDLFVVRAIEQYLKPDGKFAFVMPFAVLSRRQFAGFRTGHWGGPDGAIAQLERPEDFARVKPPLFPVPSCVVSGVRATVARPLPSSTAIWSGNVANKHFDWPAASNHLFRADGEVAAAVDSSESPYRRRFRQGATLVPRMLVTVETSARGPLGVVQGRLPVRSARSSNEKRPWKELPALEGIVEAEFVRPMHVGATMVAYRARNPESAIVPFVDGRLIGSADERLDEYPGLARWWREAERTWETHRTAATRLTLLQQIDFQGKLAKQFPIAPRRVVYTKSGQHMAACRVDDPSAVIDHTLYWTTVRSLDEGLYLSAVLNSQVLAACVVALQSRGQHNPRHFDMHVFALPFPIFDPADDIHRRLAALAAVAEDEASALTLDDTWQFQKARRFVRDALRTSGVAAQIDDAVAELLAASASQAPTAPDLMAVLGQAMPDQALRPSHPRRTGQRERLGAELPKSP